MFKKILVDLLEGSRCNFFTMSVPGYLGLIAYTSNRGGSYEIWLYNPINGANVPLTTGLGETFSSPFWSPDSRRIAFIGKGGILYVVNITSGAIASIDQFSDGLGIYLDWSPDSQKLVYVKQDDIILYNVITHQVQRINQPDATDVQWFPNGTELLFQAPDVSGNSQIFRIRTDGTGTGKQQVTQNDGGRLNTVRLSPDGKYALYTTPGASISIIYTVEMSTGRVYEVRGRPLAKNYFPVWSPDSNTISYSATAYEDSGYFSLIRTAGKQGESERTKGISNCFATPVTWSPKGDKIAYLSGCNNQGPASEMWLIDVKHAVPIRLLKGVLITSLQWSPMSVSPLKKTFTNTTYKVQFQYPAHWQRITTERYEGTDGFFRISAISAEGSINDVCQDEAFHQLMPYGSDPRIVKTQIQNQDACFIFPSKDQPLEMRGQAALIVRYPTPIQISGTTYNYFILWADQTHIKEISSKLSFIIYRFLRIQ
jgi:TolB protein